MGKPYVRHWKSWFDGVAGYQARDPLLKNSIAMTATSTKHESYATRRNVIEKLISAREEAGLRSTKFPHAWKERIPFSRNARRGERSIEIFELIQLTQIYAKPPQYFLPPN
jgi:hypothetical protein